MPSRYHVKLKNPITMAELSGIMSRVEVVPEASTLGSLVRTSLVSVLFYTGLRIGEVVGDANRKWKVLTEAGVQLSRTPAGLPKSWMDTEEGVLWEWKHRGYLPGILREDIHREGEILYVDAMALKHGKRENPLELSLNWPYADLIRKQWEKASPGARVWPISQASARIIVKRGAESLYPHAFRFSLATNFARDPSMSVADLQGWFGWSRSATADSYIIPSRSRVKARATIGRMIKEVS